MNIFAKKIGKFLNIVFKGKPKTVKTESKEEMDELIHLIKESSNGDEKSLNQLKEKLFVETGEDDVLQELSEVIAETESTVEELKDEINVQKKVKLDYKKHLNDGDFKVVKEDGVQKVYLKPFINAEMPSLLVDKIVKSKSMGDSIDNLINFWMASLLNENADARRGLYNFISKQNLYVTKEGYFVAFRRIESLRKHIAHVAKLDISDATMKRLRDKVRKQKKGVNSMIVIKKDDGSYDVASTRVKNPKGKVLGTVKEVMDILAVQSKSLDDRMTFTDNRTKKMVIRIGEPVRIKRSECDKNPNVECSFGLHVGSKDYVLRNDWLGDTIVICLVNPQHVISVPYSDAHKMRVCEYLPIKSIGLDELSSFSISMIEDNAIKYKKIENDKINKAIAVLDELTEEERKKFSTKKVDRTMELEESKKKLEKSKEKYNKVRRELDLLLEDDVSKVLDLNEVRNILKSRVK